MTQTQHTPGPWALRMTGWQTNPAAIYSPCRPGAVACIPARTSVPLDEQSANASLIAAAPDMLAALEFVLPCLTDINANHPQALSDDELAQIKRTIAKAKGANEMSEKLHEVLVNTPLAPQGEIHVVSKWERVGPELLEALEELIESQRGDWPLRQVRAKKQARIAIAKAKGA